jgi:hypothetical protein
MVAGLAERRAAIEVVANIADGAVAQERLLT